MTDTTDPAATDDLPARALKFVGRDTVEGPAFLFTPDIVGESFTPDTDLCIEWFGKSGRPILYEHGLDDALKAIPVGRQIDYESRAEGIWAQGQLDRHARYRKAIDGLIEKGALAWSGGAMQHLATKSLSGAIKRFPWVELSLTPTPANHQNAALYYLKSADAIEHMAAAEIEIPDPLKAALFALDEWANNREDDGLPDGLKFADHIDRLLVDAKARVEARKSWHLKSGRVLSAQTRERLTRHPASLRELADDLDELLRTADASKSAPDFTALALATEAALARSLGVALPGETS